VTTAIVLTNWCNAKRNTARIPFVPVALICILVSAYKLLFTFPVHRAMSAK
jgi:hypothetical protein